VTPFGLFWWRLGQNVKERRILVWYELRECRCVLTRVILVCTFQEYVKSTSKDLKREVSSWAGAAWTALSTQMAGSDGAAPSQAVDSPATAAVDVRPESADTVQLVYGKLNGGDRVRVLPFPSGNLPLPQQCVQAQVSRN
jgi:hypothetical protein